MPEFAYTAVPGKIKDLLAKIRQVGVPEKATVAWLKSVGFRSSNDTSLLVVLKFVDLIDGNSVPTQRWIQFRGNTHKSVLGKAIKEGYKDLYAIYPDAHSRDKTEIAHVFSTSTTAGQQVVTRTVTTFKALCEEATFNGIADEHTLTSGPLHTPIAEPNAPLIATSSRAIPSVHIDIQVHIAPESTTEQVDAIFKSMAKHLYGAKAE